MAHPTPMVWHCGALSTVRGASQMLVVMPESDNKACFTLDTGARRWTCMSCFISSPSGPQGDTESQSTPGRAPRLSDGEHQGVHPQLSVSCRDAVSTPQISAQRLGLPGCLLDSLGPEGTGSLRGGDQAPECGLQSGDPASQPRTNPGPHSPGISIPPHLS